MNKPSPSTTTKRPDVLFLGFLLVYRLLLHFLIAAARWTLWFWPEKAQKTFELKDSGRLPLLAEDPIWIHAASGEIEYAKALIREIQREYPTVPLVISYSSPSAERLLPEESERLKTFPLPWDSRKESQRVFEMLKPRMLLIARTDLWPELLYQARKHQVPTLLFAMTLSEDSSRLKIWARWFFRRLLGLLTEIHCVGPEDKANLESLSTSTQILQTGDARYDQVIYRRQHPRLNEAKSSCLQGKTLIAGSTWPQDEAVLLPAVSDFLSAGNSLVIAPHELKIKHLAGLEESFRVKGFSVARFTEHRKWDRLHVLILDQVGILADIYSWGSCAFVGGSFRDKVHSVMEPLSHGLPVAVGPLHTNNREACDFQKLQWGDSSPVTVVHSATELKSWLDQILTKGFDHTRLKREVESRTGGTQAVMTFIRKHLN